MKEDNSKERNADALAKISKDRTRTNLLKNSEQKLIAFLVQRIPQSITSNMLTAIGFAGSLIVTSCFLFGKYFDRYWLLLGILGFAINWFGDSLDGRVAYYRNKPRKWYGFSLDFTIDWISNIAIGLGYMLYVGSEWGLLGYGFVTLYGWAMMMALLRYKIIGTYTIDSGLLSPTEVRFIISFMLILEVLFPGAVIYFGMLICVVLLIVNLIDFSKLLKASDLQDKEEREKKNNL